MHDRILWLVKLLLVGLALTAFCAADDGNQLLNTTTANGQTRPTILPAKGPEKLQLAAPQQLRAEHPGAIISGASPANEFDGVEKTLAGYRSAFEAMSLAQISEVWPDLDRRHQAAFKGVFEFLRKTSSAPRLDLECAAPAMAGGIISIECREAVTYMGEESKPETVGPVRVSILLKKQSNNWVIQGMKAL
jgi:hypothetical protein